MSPAKPQDRAFIAYLLIFPNLCLTSSPKLSCLAFNLTQAKETQNHPPSDGNFPEKLSHRNRPSRHFACADGPRSDLWNDL